MSNEEILNELGLSKASDEIKERVIENVRTIVELRTLGVISELIPDDQEAKLTELQAQSDSQAIWDWLKTEVVGADVSEVYEATLKDYLEERKNEAFQA